MLYLTAWQVASIRIISSGIILLPVAYRSFKKIPSNKIFTVIMSGVLGSLLPAYLFCMAEQEIDSALAGVLNSLTPIFVIIIGALFFQMKTSAQKVLGIVIAFAGSLLLFFSQPGFSHNSNTWYVLMVVLATVMYGINVNLVHRYLGNIPSLQIASMALCLNAIPACIILYFSGFFQLNFHVTGILVSTAYSIILGVFGTAIASVIFYMLIKKAGAVFSSMVTYVIPVVAIGWGILYGEAVGWKQALSLVIILAGVYIANKKISPAQAPVITEKR